MIRFGIVGTSQISSKAAQAMRLCPRTEPAAVCSRDRERGKRFAEENGIGTVCTSFEELAPCVDAVYIASPNALHYEQSLWFLERGTPVLCEKPLTSDLARTEALFRAAREHRTVLAEAYKSRYMPGYALVREHLPALGPVRNARLAFSKYSSRYDAHKAGETVNTFLARFANGALLDLGVYCLYPALDWFGVPDRVCASGFLVPGGADGAGSLLMSYPDKTVELNYSKVSDTLQKSEIQGEKGTMVINAISSPRQIALFFRDGTSREIGAPECRNDMIYEMDAFADMVQAGRGEDPDRLRSAFRILDEARRQVGIVYPSDGVPV